MYTAVVRISYCCEAKSVSSSTTGIAVFYSPFYSFLLIQYLLVTMLCTTKGVRINQVRLPVPLVAS